MLPLIFIVACPILSLFRTSFIHTHTHTHRVPLHLTLHCGNSLIKFQWYGAEVIGNLLLLAQHHQERRLSCSLAAFLHSLSQIVSGWNVSHMQWSRSSHPAHILTWTRQKSRKPLFPNASFKPPKQLSST